VEYALSDNLTGTGEEHIAVEAHFEIPGRSLYAAVVPVPLL
jgi:hypothetical protein